jgi:hypothetical protein
MNLVGELNQVVFGLRHPENLLLGGSRLSLGSC